ncbi:unnamed protein product (macronuclear) [Paramecium tetraurelia]|uniref:Uncharacterized protein n=1 Tax=Paramecium tetraurelia TaxID=5888 RepID=A0DK31_PARTE|nr:uncharacterized protein GSPATT00039548001 [Paramecium tetraurelia]CAK83398.1 unnamed protein product [Paramecium tetraurelia]
MAKFSLRNFRVVENINLIEMIFVASFQTQQVKWQSIFFKNVHHD